MKYKIRAFTAPHVLVEYSTDDDQHKAMLNVRIDKKLDGSLPQGAELDEYILSYAPILPPIDPYEGVDWSFIEEKVEINQTQITNIPQVIANFNSSAQYMYTVYNADIKQDIAHVYSAGNVLIKTNIDKTEVIEYYEANVTVDNEQFIWVSRDIHTNEIIDKYRRIIGGLEKVTLNDEPTVKTFFGSYDTIDPRLQPLLSDFDSKEKIMAWSQKSSGLIVEYKKY